MWLIILLCFVIVGLALFLVSVAKYDWSFKKFAQRNFMTNEYVIDDNFNKIIIFATTANIDFKPSTDGKCKVVCYENKKETHKTYVENGELKIKKVNKKKWYDYLDIISALPKITMYLPDLSGASLSLEVSTGNVKIPKEFSFESIDISGTTSDIKCFASSTKQTKIHVTTGDIIVENASAESYDLAVTTGDIKLKNVNCQNLVSTGSTGDIKMQELIAVNKISITTSTGEVEFYRCDAGEIVITTSTGDIEGSLLSSKQFIVQTNTGDIDIPSTVSGGRCEIKTKTGDIEITIANN